MPGPITPTEWNGLKATGYSGPPHKFIIRGGQLSVIPTMGAGNSLAFEYVSNQWAESSGGTAQASFQADTDVPKLSEELIIYGMIYEWLEGEGQPSARAALEYMNLFDKLAKDDQPNAGIMVAGDLFARTGRGFSGQPAVNFNLTNYG